MASVKIAGVPHVKQRPDFCGEACAEMYLRKLKVPIDQDGVFEQSGVDPALGRGCYTADLARALDHVGFKTGAVWYSIPAQDAWSSLNDEFAALHADLQRGVPSIVCMRYDDEPKSPEHFRLVLGYDAQTDDVLYHDPAQARGRVSADGTGQIPANVATQERRREVDRRPAEVGAGPIDSPHQTRRADFERRLRPAHSQASSRGFRRASRWCSSGRLLFWGMSRRRPFASACKNTVDWAVSRLKRDFFERNPSEIIDIWLFEDGPTYEEYTQRLFGEKPTTPYGFYSPRHHALIMNIATGGGTLVHEIVHPFMASNFPDCPSWFNEGLASLYEQAQDRDGHIAGLTNWRLRGLKAAIHDGEVPPFEKLCSTTTREFYDRDRGTNYAQARYLCYYLQEHDLLVKFYRAFRRNAGTDPTGIDTLKAILGEENLAEFQRRWEKYVLKLEFEP